MNLAASRCSSTSHGFWPAGMAVSNFVGFVDCVEEAVRIDEVGGGRFCAALEFDVISGGAATFKEFSHLASEDACEFFEHANGDVAFARLNLRNRLPCDARAFGEFHLGEPPLGAFEDDIAPQDVHRSRSFGHLNRSYCVLPVIVNYNGQCAATDACALRGSRREKITVVG